MTTSVYINNSIITSQISTDTGIILPKGDDEFSLGFTLTSRPQGRSLLFSWGVNKPGGVGDQLIVFFDRQPGHDQLFIGWGDDQDQSNCFYWIIGSFIDTDGNPLNIFDLLPHKFLITKPDTNTSTISFTFDLYIDGKLQTPSRVNSHPGAGFFTTIQNIHSSTNQILSIGGETVNIDGETSWYGGALNYDFSGGGSLTNIILWDEVVTWEEYLDTSSTDPVVTATGATCSIVPKNLNLF